RRERRRLTHRGGLQVDRKFVGQVSRHPSRHVGARKAGEGGEQRTVVVDRPRHLVVETLVILPFDPVGAELDSLADQNAGGGLRVVVGILGTRYGDRKPW